MKGHSWYISCRSSSLPASASFCSGPPPALSASLREVARRARTSCAIAAACVNGGTVGVARAPPTQGGNRQTRGPRGGARRRGGTLKAPPMPSHTGRCSLVCVQANIQGIARRSSMLPAACAPHNPLVPFRDPEHLR